MFDERTQPMRTGPQAGVAHAWRWLTKARQCRKRRRGKQAITTRPRLHVQSSSRSVATSECDAHNIAASSIPTKQRQTRLNSARVFCRRGGHSRLALAAPQRTRRLPMRASFSAVLVQCSSGDADVSALVGPSLERELPFAVLFGCSVLAASPSVDREACFRRLGMGSEIVSQVDRPVLRTPHRCLCLLLPSTYWGVEAEHLEMSDLSRLRLP